MHIDIKLTVRQRNISRKESGEDFIEVSLASENVPITAEQRSVPASFSCKELKDWGIKQILFSQGGMIAFVLSDRFLFRKLVNNSMGQGIWCTFTDKSDVPSSHLGFIDPPKPTSETDMGKQHYHIKVNKKEHKGATIFGPPNRKLSIIFQE